MINKTLIKNAVIYDGTGSHPFTGDVLIGDGLIQKVGLFLEEDCAVVDGTGKILSPGFINCHSHSELQPFMNPNMYQVVGQGITTEIVGQEGLSVAPIDDAHLKELTENMIPLCGKSDEPYPWRSHGEFMREVDKAGAGAHLVGLIGSGTIRMCVMGSENRPATDEEIEKMCALMDQCMKEGARGISFGLIYPPSSYASEEEMIAICKVVAANDGIIMVHTRDEMNHLMEAFEEMVRVMKGSGARMEISHLKSPGPSNWGIVAGILKRMDELTAEGYDIGFDQYPWDAGSTGMKVMIPGWAYAGGVDKFGERLKDPATKAQIVKETEAILKERENGKCVQIAAIPESTEDLDWTCGLRLDKVAEILKMDEVSAIFYILLRTRSTAVCVYHSISEDDVQMVMKSPYHVVCTDGIVGTVPHPRAYSSFPRFLGRYVRDLGIMPLETAIHHITGEPARRLRLWDRGLIREGMLADLVLFDYDRIMDTNSYAEPIRLPEGILKVWVSGVLRYQERDRL